MPRTARIDAPGLLHHVRVRGIERRKIFIDDADRLDFLNQRPQFRPISPDGDGCRVNVLVS